MTQKQLNKILTLLEEKRKRARDLWFNARKYQLESEQYWLGQFLGLDITLQQAYDIAGETDNA